MFVRSARIECGLGPVKIYSKAQLGSKLRRSFATQNTTITMATGTRVHLKASQQPEFYVKGLTPESADRTSQLLQVNHEKHHIFFNRSGFHVSSDKKKYEHRLV
jgi:UDP-N-acetyl-D-mannosaminuronic acid transferase (WecB/TagA/CpsF family)